MAMRAVRFRQGWPARSDVLHHVGREHCKHLAQTGVVMRIRLAGSRWNKGKHLGADTSMRRGL